MGKLYVQHSVFASCAPSDLLMTCIFARIWTLKGKIRNGSKKSKFWKGQQHSSQISRTVTFATWPLKRFIDGRDHHLLRST